MTHDEPKWRRYVRFWRRDAIGDVKDELEFHFENRVAEFQAAGMSRPDAVAAARARFGDVEIVRRDLEVIDARIERETIARHFVDAFLTDLRNVLRGLRHRPAIALTVTITLAIAVGANGALFSLLDPLFFRPPTGVSDAGSLRRLYTARPRAEFSVGSAFSYPEYRALREGLTSKASVAIDQARDSVEVTFTGGVFTTGVSYASAEYLPLLGERIDRGRAFSSAEDDVASPATVAVVGHTLAERMGGAGAALGQQIRIHGTSYVVVGVTADDFEGIGLSRISAWVPFSTMPREQSSPGEKPWYDRGDRYIELVVRLAKGVPARAVEAQAAAIYRHFLTEKGYDSSATLVVGPLSVYRVTGAKDTRTLITTRTSAVATLLLLIACANVSNLFLAIGVARRREIAVRLALGVSRGRLAGLLLLESLVLAAIAGVASLVIAEWAGGLLRVQLLPRVSWAHAAVGMRVLVFTGLTTVTVAGLCGALPALMAWNGNVGDVLRHGTIRVASGHRRTRSTLLAIQATLSVVLLAGAALFGRTLQAALATNLGYERDRLVTTQVYFADRSQRTQIAALMPGVAERVVALPGVEGVALTYGAPTVQWAFVPIYRADADSAHPLENESYFIGVSPAYFAVTSTRLVDGRGFLPSDRAHAAPVIIVGQTMARQIWPGTRAVGQCLRPISPSHPCYTVVGVAADVHEFRIQEPTGWQYYYPLDQMPTHASERTLVIRTREDRSESVAASVQSMLRSTFTGAESHARTIDQALLPELVAWSLGLKLFGALAAFALIVAMVGVYGVVSFEARQRTREIGVRLALGAGGMRIAGTLVRHSTIAVGVGALIGLSISLAAGRFLRSLLYGVTPSDPLALGIASALLLLAAAVAAGVPAWRAQRIDPAVVLREE